MIPCHHRHVYAAYELITSLSQGFLYSILGRALTPQEALQLCVSSLDFAKDDYTVCILDYSYKCPVASVMDHLFRRTMVRLTAIVTDINDK